MEIGWDTILGLVSFFLSGLTLYYTWTVDRKHKELQNEVNKTILEERMSMEENKKKAIIQCFKINTLPGMPGCVRIENTGYADAFNLDFTCSDEGIPFLERDDGIFPYPKLVSGQSIEVHYINTSDYTYQTLVFSWDDEYRKGESREIVINL